MYAGGADSPGRVRKVEGWGKETAVSTLQMLCVYYFLGKVFCPPLIFHLTPKVKELKEAIRMLEIAAVVKRRKCILPMNLSVVFGSCRENMNVV